METKWETIEPNVWKPVEPEDSIEGVLILKKENVGINNSNAYYIENKDGQFMVWGATVLDSRMEYVEVGEKIRITYIETRKNAKGQDTKIFKVEREQQEETKDE